ncbi:type II toxin-antitoxin system prevent-host-death family antitoxin [Mycolicibacter virginiensis]|uniref:type II toxin-antitoxin system prevent-host-death family antitoxin n=1 Tax=Mycolicibacter virginiensis TaxID=1795032 RepID=UPI001F04793B|nr:type II toxin-antitoxin system prevent-host-death family antitoxin [Mycolicibacter virginiensis]ULP45938.1 type II toxin-antitoxin system prevent-host-death family antitoxin [Mycolicibacter virginiensis]
MTDRRVPIAEARARLSAVIKSAADGDIILMSHGRPAAVLMSPEHYRSLLDELDDLQDRLGVLESRDAPAVPFDQAMAELGITDEVRSSPPRQRR